MLPTFTIPLSTPGSTSSGDSLSNPVQNLLPDSAVEPIASFASELKLRAPYPLTPPPQSGELPIDSDGLPPDLADMLQTDGEVFPVNGNDLPRELKQIIAELRGIERPLRGTTPAQVVDPGTEPPVLDTRTATDVRLPPGLRFDTEISDSGGISSVVELDVRSSDTQSAVDPNVAAALAAAQAMNQPSRESATTGPLLAEADAPVAVTSSQPASATSESPIEQLARLARVPAERLEQVLDRRQVSAADLQRMVDSINQRLQAVERVAAGTSNAAAELPQAAAVVRVDGTPMDGKSQRFRPLGIGLPTPAGVELDIPDAELKPVVQPRGDVVAADLLHREAINALKPQSATAQVHALGGQVAAQFSTPQGLKAPDADGTRTLSGTLDVPVKDPSWGDRLNERVVMMANNRQQNIDLRLSPAELGPLRVKVSMEDGTATVSFVAQHAVTREAIEQAMPRLRTLLEQNGIDLGQASVDQRPAEQFAGDAGTEGDGGSAEGGWGEQGDSADATADHETSSAQRISRGLLDTFV